MDPAGAARQAGFRVRIPRALPAPAAVYARRLGPASEVTLVWPPGDGLPATAETGVGLLLSELQAGVHPAILKKLVGGTTQVRAVTVGGGPGWWISGAPHTLTYVTPEGLELTVGTRLTGDVLLWERDGITYRLERALGLQAALRLAGSVR